MRKTTDRRRRARSSSSTTARRPSTTRACGRCAARASSCCRRTAASPAPSTAGSSSAPAADDVVVLNSDVSRERGWLERLQYTALPRAADRHRRAEAALRRPADPVRGLLPQPRRAGVVRSPLPVQGGRRTRRPTSSRPCSGTTGACMYIKRAALDAIGAFDEAYGMAYEDMDYCLRGWVDGLAHLLHARAPRSLHLESQTRPTEPGPRELASQRYFWQRWGRFFDERSVRTPDGAAAGRLRDRGHRRRRRPPRHLRAPQPARRARPRRAAVLARRRARLVPARGADADVRGLRRARRTRSSEVDAIKVATWWNTAQPGLAGVGDARHPGLLRPGHRDVVLPGRHGDDGARARVLPPGVPLHDDLGLEPRPARRARARAPSWCRRASTSRPSGRCRASRAATTCCSRSAARTRSRTSR